MIHEDLELYKKNMTFHQNFKVKYLRNYLIDLAEIWRDVASF